MNNRFKILAAFAGLLTALTAGSSAAQTCVNPPSGLVSWWPGDGNANDIQGGNNGTPQGNLWFVPGKVGQAFASDPATADSAAVGNAASLHLQAFTFDAWVKLNTTALTGTGPAIISFGTGGYGFGIAGPSQPPRVSGELFLTQVGSSNVGSGTTVADTNWHFIAVTLAGGTATFYIDGVASTPVSYGPTFTFTTNAFIVDGFRGLVDEIEVYNRALSP